MSPGESCGGGVVGLPKRFFPAFFSGSMSASDGSVGVINGRSTIPSATGRVVRRVRRRSRKVLSASRRERSDESSTCAR